MQCRVCKSENLRKFEGELTASLADLKFPPVYICQSVLLCLNCGFAEMMVPVTDLELLNKRMAALGS
jgi:hypothetical protein